MSSPLLFTRADIDSILKPLPPSICEFLVGDNKDNVTSTLYGYNVSRPEGSKLDILRQYPRDDSSPEKIIGICNIVTLAPFMVNGHRIDRTYYDVVGKCFWFYFKINSTASLLLLIFI